MPHEGEQQADCVSYPAAWPVTGCGASEQALMTNPAKPPGTDRRQSSLIAAANQSNIGERASQPAVAVWSSCEPGMMATAWRVGAGRLLASPAATCRCAFLSAPLLSDKASVSPSRRPGVAAFAQCRQVGVVDEVNAQRSVPVFRASATNIAQRGAADADHQHAGESRRQSTDRAGNKLPQTP